jgi:hypothetical protein
MKPEEAQSIDLTGFLTDIKATVDGVATKATLMETQLADVLKGKDKEVAVANLEEKGILDGVMSFEFMHVPVGQAVAGGFIAVLATELVDGFLSKQSVQMKGGVKLAGAWASVMYGKKVLGPTGSKVVAVLLTFDALRDLTPIDAWAAKLASMLTGVFPMAGLADKANRRDVNAQASQVANDYYSRAFGKR